MRRSRCACLKELLLSFMARVLSPPATERPDFGHEQLADNELRSFGTTYRGLSRVSASTRLALSVASAPG